MTCETYVTEGDALPLNSQTAGSDSTMWLPHYHLEQGYTDTFEYFITAAFLNLSETIKNGFLMKFCIGIGSVGSIRGSECPNCPYGPLTRLDPVLDRLKKNTAIYMPNAHCNDAS